MKLLENDVTTSPPWLAVQQHRLLGFEILTHVIRVHPDEHSPMTIQEKTGVDKGAPNYVYEKKFIPALLKSLGASNPAEARSAVRRLRDETR